MIRTILHPSAAALLLLGTVACVDESPSAASSADPALSSVPHSTARGIRDLGTFGWDHGFGFEINDRGDVAGRTESGPFTAPTGLQAVLWSPRTGVTHLPGLGGASSETRALNEHGLVVGAAQKAGDAMFQRHPVVWKVGPHGAQAIELGAFANGQAEDVNNRGWVVGWGQALAAPQQAFRWSERDGLQPIPPLGGPRSVAAGINESGDIVGSSTLSATPPIVDNAVIWWHDGGTTVIGNMGWNTSGRSINQHGEVAGFGQPCIGCPFRAFYWSQETGFIDLHTPGETRSFAFEIDNRGRVAGWYETLPGPVQHAFIWTREGGKVLLPTLGGAGSSTGSINGRGQVTGRAQTPSGAIHAVIWQLGPD